MRPSKDFLKKPVITIDEGRYLGEVKDLYLDEALNWLAGINLGSAGLLRRKALIVSREDVVVFGIDAVLVKHREVVKNEDEVEETEKWLPLSELQGRAVDTPGGTKVGQIGDVILDQEARVSRFRLSKVFVAGTIAEDPTIPRGAMLDTGGVDGVMTIDLPKAEQPEAVSASKTET
jgi:sporulation protein YlmC with PRC-barrel domain